MWHARALMGTGEHLTGAGPEPCASTSEARWAGAWHRAGRRGRGFSYRIGNRRARNESKVAGPDEGLAAPPASHEYTQAVGIDNAGRPTVLGTTTRWRVLRDRQKFEHMLEFGPPAASSTSGHDL